MSNSDTHRQLVVFSLGREEYGLPIAQVREIVRYTDPRPLASAPAGIRGAISVRGERVPVCDLAARLGVAADPAKIVIVETGAGVAGVIVDDVREVLTVAADQLDPASACDSAFIEAIARVGDRLVSVLHTDGVLDGAALKAVA
jgi:purine-binding chemotaxis protein CheW